MHATSGKRKKRRTTPDHSSRTLLSGSSDSPMTSTEQFMTGEFSSAEGITTLPWRGHRWKVQRRRSLTSFPTPTAPTVVRFQSSSIPANIADEFCSKDNNWTLGLVINSYLKDDKKHVMHVISLNNGREVHVPAGSVEHVSILQQCDADDDIPDSGPALVSTVSGGHASSIDMHHASATSAGTFDSFEGEPSIPEVGLLEEELDDGWTSWFNFVDDRTGTLVQDELDRPAPWYTVDSDGELQRLQVQ